VVISKHSNRCNPPVSYCHHYHLTSLKTLTTLTSFLDCWEDVRSRKLPPDVLLQIVTSRQRGPALCGVCVCVGCVCVCVCVRYKKTQQKQWMNAFEKMSASLIFFDFVECFWSYLTVINWIRKYEIGTFGWVRVCVCERGGCVRVGKGVRCCGDGKSSTKLWATARYQKPDRKIFDDWWREVKAHSDRRREILLEVTGRNIDRVEQEATIVMQIHHPNGQKLYHMQNHTATE
jgi:hypothetical protein